MRYFGLVLMLLIVQTSSAQIHTAFGVEVGTTLDGKKTSEHWTPPQDPNTWNSSYSKTFNSHVLGIRGEAQWKHLIWSAAFLIQQLKYHYSENYLRRTWISSNTPFMRWTHRESQTSYQLQKLSVPLSVGIRYPITKHINVSAFGGITFNQSLYGYKHRTYTERYLNEGYENGTFYHAKYAPNRPRPFTNHQYNLGSSVLFKNKWMLKLQYNSNGTIFYKVKRTETNDFSDISWIGPTFFPQSDIHCSITYFFTHGSISRKKS
jgi:hypothetical protein